MAGIVIVFALAGFVIALAIGLLIAPLFGFPQMEGGAAIFAVLIAGPVGALAGMAAARVVAQRYPDPGTRRKILIGVLSVAGAIVAGNALMALVWSSDMLSQSASKIGFEIRLPPGMPPPALRDDVRIELRSAKDNRKADMYEGLWLQKDGGRSVIRGVVEMYYVSPERVIAMRIGAGPTQLFRLRMRSRPKSDPGFYGDWFAVDQVDDNTGAAPRPPRPDEAFDIRYFVTVPD